MTQTHESDSDSAHSCASLSVAAGSLAYRTTLSPLLSLPASLRHSTLHMGPTVSSLVRFALRVRVLRPYPCVLAVLVLRPRSISSPREPPIPIPIPQSFSPLSVSLRRSLFSPVPTTAAAAAVALTAIPCLRPARSAPRTQHPAPPPPPVASNARVNTDT